MAKNDIDKPIPNLDESWENYLGTRVEEFLKKFLQELDTTKHGAWSLTTDDSGLATFRAFANDAAKEAYAKDPANNSSLVLAEANFYTSGAASVDYTLATRITKQPVADMVKGTSNPVKFTYNSYYGGDPTDLDTENGYAKVWINNTEVPELGLTLTPGGNEYTIDLGAHLNQETNAVRIEVGNNHGKSRTFTFTIRALEIVLAMDNSYEESLLREDAWSLRVSCRGVAAQVHVSVDGTEIAQSTITNSTNDFIIDPNGTLAPGAHTISIYAENTTYGISTQPITTSFIKKGLGTPSICIGANADKQVTLYDTASIPYFLYYPNSGGQQVTVNFEVRDTSGIKLADLTSQTVTLKADGTSGMQELRLTAADNNYLTLGTIVAAIKVASTTTTHTLTVLDAGVTLEPATECKIYLSAAGRTNADADAEDWHSTYNGQRTCSVKRSDNFKLVGNNGFGNNAFLIKAGKSITIDGFYPFGADFGVNAANAAARTGRTFEFELRALNCTNTDTKIIDAMADGIGFAIYANRIELCSDAGGKVETIYTDEQKIRVGFCIDGTTTHCRNVLLSGVEESDANIAFVYLNGVIVRMMDYKTSVWQQHTPKKITIGSPDCDVELYTVRIYDKSLNYQQMLGNFAYDTPDLAEKIAIAKRNNILDSTNAVDFAKTVAALPNTPYKIWEIAKMPTGKKDWQKATTEFINPAWEANPGSEPAALASFTCENHDIALDGTSSLSYPDPYKNWADKYNGTWSVVIDGVKVTITGYAITSGVKLKAKEFVDKVNFASSEGIFNILAANAYQNILLGTAQQYPELLTAQQAAQQAAGKPVTYRQSLSGFPIIGWLRSYNAGVASVRFLSIYNFVNNKYDPYYFGFDNSGDNQLWEVEDNVNFFSEEIPEGKWQNGKWNDKATTLYYARVPKKSPVTDDDFGVALNAEGTTQANNESKWLRRFHNWVYSCNPNIAERYRLVNGSYKQLTRSVTYGDTVYTHDTPAYRLAKFNAEHTQYLNKSSALFYFIFFSWILGVDSMDKNMTIGFENVTTTDTPKAFFVQRDSDTAGRYGNRGTLIFQVFHEWGDSYNESTGETGTIIGEEYNAETQTFTVKTTAGSPIFNGRLSGLWDCVAKAWPEDIKAMYQAMRSNGLNEQTMWALYNSFWSQWCEALYNTDGMGYANTGRFDMAHGDKREVMRHFFKYRQRYWDSKCGANTSSSLELRLWSNGNGVALRHSAPIYASLNWGAGGIQTVRSIKPGEPAYFESNGATFNETTFTVYDADLLTEISTYTELPDGTKVESGLQDIATSLDATGLEYCKRLEKLVLDYSGKNPNTNLSSRVTNIGNSIALKKLVVRNCPNVTGAFNLQSEKIEEIDLRDTGATAVTIPQTDALTSIQLGKSIRTISYKDFPNLQTLTLQGFSQLTSVEIENCPKLDARTLIEDILSAEDNILRRAKLRGIDWQNFAVTYLEMLADMKADITGHIQLQRTAIVNFDLKRKLLEAWGNVDDENNPLYIEYTKRELTTVTIGGDRYIDEITPEDDPEKYKLTVAPAIPNANNFTKISWKIATNNYATIDETTGVLTVTAIGTEDRAPKAKVTVEITLSDGTKLTEETTIGFYKRSCHLGDYVFADGTYSDLLDSGKTPVGVCFYINPADKTQRLCVALANLPSYQWGLYPVSDNNGFTGIELADTPGYSIFNIPTMTDKGDRGLTGNYINPTTYRDETTSGDPDGFKILSTGSAVGEIGFEAITTKIGQYPEGTKLPYGLINTLRIIAHRNTILSDSAVNLQQPQQIGTTSPYQHLLQLMSDVVTDNGGLAKYRQFYYPAASLCNCYEPGVKQGETLADKFKAGKWFLPSEGELARIYWYHRQGYTVGATDAIFAQAVADGRMTAMSNAWHWSSTENSQSNAWNVGFSDGNTNLNSKYDSVAVRAVAAF